MGLWLDPEAADYFGLNKNESWENYEMNDKWEMYRKDWGI
jgi:hypothetical protein